MPNNFIGVLKIDRVSSGYLSGRALHEMFEIRVEGLAQAEFLTFSRVNKGNRWLCRNPIFIPSDYLWANDHQCAYHLQ